jgi:membrane protein
MADRPAPVARLFRPLAGPVEITRIALVRLMSDDGWALASHVALSVILAIFPFLIFVTALAGFLGVKLSAAQIYDIVFEGWPQSVAGPISREVIQVLTVGRRDLLTFGVLLTIWFSSGGVEALRVALERAYGATSSRPWWLRRPISIAFAVASGIGLILVAVLVVLFPVLWRVAVQHLPQLREFRHVTDVIRYGVTALFLTGGLLAAHLWLAPGRRRIRDVLPGIVLTIVLWLVTATAFGYYVVFFATYASTYAGLGGIMAALVFLDINALVFILGAEINAAILARRARRRGEAERGTDAVLPGIEVARPDIGSPRPASTPAQAREDAPAAAGE